MIKDNNLQACMHGAYACSAKVVPAVLLNIVYKIITSACLCFIITHFPVIQVTLK